MKLSRGQLKKHGNEDVTESEMEKEIENENGFENERWWENEIEREQEGLERARGRWS